MQYVILPVLWMTSCFHTMSRMARGIGNNDVQDAVLNFVSLFYGRPME